MKKKKINNKKGFPSNKHLGCCVLNESNLDVFGGTDIFDIWYHPSIKWVIARVYQVKYDGKGSIKHYDHWQSRTAPFIWWQAVLLK